MVAVGAVAAAAAVVAARVWVEKPVTVEEAAAVVSDGRRLVLRCW